MNTPDKDTLNNEEILSKPIPANYSYQPETLDLSPARWIWYPSERVLPNTFVLFRKEIILHSKPVQAKGWIIGESRYLLRVNGERIQWGPAPYDPRWVEADPFELVETLQKGKNVIGATVLYYGHGDGTWPIGKPGFIFRLDIELADGTTQTIVSDTSWQSHLARSWQPGHYKRWFLRALQEEFDARLYPHGWTSADFVENSDWLTAMELDCPANKPATCSRLRDYINDSLCDRQTSHIRPRCIPIVKETQVPVKRMVESLWIEWKRPYYEYFESLTPGSYDVRRTQATIETQPGQWHVRFDNNSNNGAVLTFELSEEMVGFPYFTIDAPEGTIVELMFREAHEKGGPALLNTFFNSWVRFICIEGTNYFETFDHEALRWISLHIHNTQGPITVKDVGVRRRTYPWPHKPEIACCDTTIQKVLNAAVNTVTNSSIEIVQGDSARERQQYSGDCAHQLHTIYLAFGDIRLPARFISTYSQGMTVDGFFMDCWPGVDRLVRIGQREIQLTNWGPILDHGVQFVFDCWYYYMYTGEIEPLKEAYPRLLRFIRYLRSIRGNNGLLPVEDLGVPSVWIDHVGFKQQKHKQCAFNLHASSMMLYAMGPLCKIFGDTWWEKSIKGFGQQLLKTTQRLFWSSKHNLFVDNLPCCQQEGEVRTHDRTLATSILYDQCPRNNTRAAVEALKTCPPEMGFSYPPNAGWRLWALAKAGEIDTVIDELRHRWGKMVSVHENNTLSEDWNVRPDTRSQYSHCAVAPLYVLYMSIIGIRPLEPGFRRFELRPRLGDLEGLNVTIQTVKGPVFFKSAGPKGKRKINFTTPAGGSGELVLHGREDVALPQVPHKTSPGTKRYQLTEGKDYSLLLRYT